MTKLQQQFDKLKLTQSQKFEFRFRINDCVVYIEWDKALPATVYSYIVLFSEYPNIKYIKVKWFAGDESIIQEMKELRPNEYSAEILALIGEFDELHRKRISN